MNAAPVDVEAEPPGTLPVDQIPKIVPPKEETPPIAVEGPITGPPVSARLLAAAATAAKAPEAPVSVGRGSTPPTAPDTRPKLRVIRGLKVNAEYTIYEGQNLIGRRDDRPVDIDIEEQEPADRVWSSRQHAVITCENGKLAIEDLNSLNGTFVNRQRVHPGRKRSLLVNDIVTIGTIHLKVTL
ncbi:MAG: FHA domain-containing protein [Gemmataceae bacterium]